MIGVSLALAFAALCAPQDDTVRDFKRYFKKVSDPWERVEFVHSLKDIDDPEVSEVLVPLLTDRDARVALASVTVLSMLPSDTAREPLKKKLEKPKSSGELSGVIRAVSMGGWKDFAPLIRPHLEHRDEEVRLWASNAAGGLADAEALPLLVTIAVEDKNPLLRVAAVDAIGIVGNSDKTLSGPALVGALEDSSLEVKTAACLAMRKVRLVEAIGPLIDLMESGKGRIVESVFPTLIEITDLQFTDSPKIWRDWWNRAEGSYELPTDEQIAKQRAARSKANEIYRPSAGATSTFTGVNTASERITFVIDVSGSMEDMVVDRDSFRDRGHTRFGKLDIVKKEMTKTISELESNVDFNIYAFASNVHAWKPGLKKANALNRRSAIAFIDKMQPIGGRASRERAAAGLSGSAAVDEGKTNTYGALLTALGLDGTEDATDKVKAKVDTVFFLSDGRPSVGDLTDPDDILKAIGEFNQFRRVTIHTIAIGEFQKDFMLELARGNGGVFVDLGR